MFFTSDWNLSNDVLFYDEFMKTLCFTQHSQMSIQMVCSEQFQLFHSFPVIYLYLVFQSSPVIYLYFYVYFYPEGRCLFSNHLIFMNGGRGIVKWSALQASQGTSISVLQSPEVQHWQISLLLFFRLSEHV